MKRPTDPVWVAISLRVLASNMFFRAIIGLFALQSIIIAVTGAYSMSFDEYFHYGIIKLYANQWSPFFGAQPAGASEFGAVTRDPSYLYHYLASFPLRIFSHFFPTFSAQIIFLRLIDTLLFVVGLLFLRKLLAISGLSKRLTNLTLLFFTLIPVTTFMAAQINYDDLLFMLTMIAGYLSVKLVNEIRERDHLPLKPLLWLLAVCCAASIVKYAFLPIMLGLFIYLILSVRKEIGLHRLKLWPAIKAGSKGLKSLAGVAAIIALLVMSALFVERYGLNTLRYHTPTPECDQVLSVDACRAYDPYGRNQSYKDLDLAGYLTTANKLTYPGTWTHSILRSFYFSVGPREQNYPYGEPLPLPYIAAYVVAIGGSLAVLWRARALWRGSHAVQLFFIVSGVYVLTLFAQNLLDYLHLGVPVAIQGRYIVPVLPFGLALVALALRDIARPFPRLAPIIVLGILLLMTLDGGGMLPFVLRSSDNWLWNNDFARTLIHGLRQVFRPIVLGS